MSQSLGSESNAGVSPDGKVSDYGKHFEKLPKKRRLLGMDEIRARLEREHEKTKYAK